MMSVCRVDIAIKPVRSYVYARLPRTSLVMLAPPMIPTRTRRKSSPLSGRCGREIEHREIDGRIPARKPGVRYLRRNAKGTIDGVLREEAPQAAAMWF